MPFAPFGALPSHSFPTPPCTAPFPSWNDEGTSDRPFGAISRLPQLSILLRVFSLCSHWCMLLICMFYRRLSSPSALGPTTALTSGIFTFKFPFCSSLDLPLAARMPPQVPELGPPVRHTQREEVPKPGRRLPIALLALLSSALDQLPSERTSAAPDSCAAHSLAGLSRALGP